MSKLSLLDKLGVLVNLSTSSIGLVVALVILLIFGILLAFTNKKNEKFNKIMYVVMTAIIIGLIIATYHSSLGNMFSYMMNNFFIAVYFPTIAIYFAAIIAMNIIVWVSIFSYKSSRQIRALNVSVYIIMNYLMALLLKVINSNKLDIFDQASLYGNKEATALIELSSLVFMVWIIFLILYKIILIYIKKEYKPKVKRIIVRKKVKKLPENFEPKAIPDYVYGKAPHKETLIIDTTEKTEEELLLERFSKQFTLDDYKLFSRLLKEEQERINNQKVDFIHIKQNEKVKGNIVKKEEKKSKPKESNIEFDTIRNYEKIRKKSPKKTEVIVKSANILEEDDYREQQKQEIIRMEEERRELLKQEQERQKELEEKKKRALEAQQRREQEEKELIERQKIQLEQERQRKQEQQRKEQHALDILLQKQLEEEREQRKLTELEMLYR